MKNGAIYPSLKGRTVLVTGGGSGIGQAIVEAFAAQGAKVGFLDIKQAESRKVVTRLKRRRQIAHFEPCDLTDIAALRKAVAAVRRQLGPVTILVNNAAHDERHKLEDVTPEYFDQRIAVNLKHQLFTIQAVVGDMKRKKNGAIINIGSGSWLLGVPDMPVYTAAKAAVLGLTRGLARDLGEHNIRVNTIAPGLIDTDMPAASLSDEARARMRESTPLKRIGQPEEMAELALFLLSERSSFITGQVITADGGRVTLP